MPVTLHVIKGPSAGRKFHVARGQIAKFGRTEWADIPFPTEVGMADIHFTIHDDGRHCVIKDSSGGIGTLVNGIAVPEAQLHSGDEVTAGSTVFLVAVEGETAPVAVADPVGNGDQNESTSPAIPMAVDYGRRLKLSDAAKELLTDDQLPKGFVDLLVEKELFPDALRYVAFVLPKPIAVGWGCECVEQVFPRDLTPLEKRAIDAAKTWAHDPNDAHCRAAEAAAKETEFTGAPSWLAVSAFWSGDSLAPADLPPVPPNETLTAEAITGALAMATALGPPNQTSNRYREFLKTGRALIPEPTAVS